MLIGAMAQHISVNDEAGLNSATTILSTLTPNEDVIQTLI